MQSDISCIKILLHIIETHQVSCFSISSYHPLISSWKKMHQIKIQDIWKTIQNFAKLSSFKQFRENHALQKNQPTHIKKN